MTVEDKLLCDLAMSNKHNIKSSYTVIRNTWFTYLAIYQSYISHVLCLTESLYVRSRMNMSSASFQINLFLIQAVSEILIE